MASEDYATAYADVYQSPSSVDSGGIYLLEEGDSGAADDSMRIPSVRASDLRMRRREGFSSRNVTDSSEAADDRRAFSQYSRDMDSQTELRSRRRGRAALDAADWDDRPRGFRADDGPRDSAFVPPPREKRTAMFTALGPAPLSNSAAMDAVAIPDPNAVNLAPCPAGQKSKFAPALQTPDVVLGAFAVGAQMLKAAAMFIAILLLAMSVIIALQLKGQIKEMRLTLRELVYNTN